VIAPREIPKQPRKVAIAREASRRRARRSRLQGYTVLGRILAVLAAGFVFTLSYVMLMANLTGLNYALGRETATRVGLQDETMRLDDQIAHLRSRERLADVAAKLGMHDPQTYAVIELPRPVASPPPNGIAFLGALFHR
jgi:cell division protein FtsL